MNAEAIQNQPIAGSRTNSTTQGGGGGASASAATSGADTAEVNPTTATLTETVLVHEVARSLELDLEIGDGSRFLRVESFHAERVAGRVLQLTQQALPADDEELAPGELEAALGRVRAGLDDGFANTRTVLGDLRHLTDEVSGELDDVRGRVDGELTERYAASVSREANRSATASVEIRTADGDLVTVEFNRQNSATQTFGSSSDGERSEVKLGSSRESNMAFSLSVDGELDRGEQRSIQKLLRGVNRVTDRFFEGDVRAAFRTAARLGVRGDDIASVSLTLSLNATERTEASASVERLLAPTEAPSVLTPSSNGAIANDVPVRPTVESNPATDPGLVRPFDIASLQTAVSYVAEVQTVIQEASASLSSDETSQRSLRGLFEGLFARKAGHGLEPRDHSLSRMFRQVMQGLFEHRAAARET